MVAAPVAVVVTAVAHAPDVIAPVPSADVPDAMMTGSVPLVGPSVIAVAVPATALGEIVTSPEVFPNILTDPSVVVFTPRTSCAVPFVVTPVDTFVSVVPAPSTTALEVSDPADAVTVPLPEPGPTTVVVVPFPTWSAKVSLSQHTWPFAVAALQDVACGSFNPSVVLDAFTAERLRNVPSLAVTAPEAHVELPAVSHTAVGASSWLYSTACPATVAALKPVMVGTANEVAEATPRAGVTSVGEAASIVPVTVPVSPVVTSVPVTFGRTHVLSESATAVLSSPSKLS